MKFPIYGKIKNGNQTTNQMGMWAIPISKPPVRVCVVIWEVTNPWSKWSSVTSCAWVINWTYNISWCHLALSGKCISLNYQNSPIWTNTNIGDVLDQHELQQTKSPTLNLNLDNDQPNHQHSALAPVAPGAPVPPEPLPAYHTHVQAHARVGALYGKGDLSVPSFPKSPEMDKVYSGTSD